jgi:hypothetical protein
MDRAPYDTLADVYEWVVPGERLSREGSVAAFDRVRAPLVRAGTGADDWNEPHRLDASSRAPRAVARIGLRGR